MQAQASAGLGALVRDLGKCVVEVEDRLAFVVDGDELGDALCEMQLVLNLIGGLHRKLVSAVGTSGVVQANGQRSTAQYVAARTSTKAALIRKAERLALWLRGFDLFSAETAIMSEEHLLYLRAKLDGPRTHRSLVRDQHIFVQIVTHAGWAEFVTVAESWLAANDPDGEEPKDQLARSSLSLHKGQGGRLVLEGQTDAVSGQLIESAIDAETEKIRREDADSDIVRTHNARRMAALVRLVERGAARDDGTYSTPLINVVVSQKVLEWLIDQDTGLYDSEHPGSKPVVPVDPNDPDGRCELIDGTPIHPHLVLALLAKANIRRVVLDANSRVLDVSYNARSFPEWMKTAALIQSRGRCDVHGCDAPHRWLQMDHVDPHSNGGQTSWFNSQPTCGPDNRHKSDRIGHIAWRDKPKPPRHRPAKYQHGTGQIQIQNE